MGGYFLGKGGMGHGLGLRIIGVRACTTGCMVEFVVMVPQAGQSNVYSHHPKPETLNPIRPTHWTSVFHTLNPKP